MADGYKTIKYKHFDRKKPMENKYTTPKTEIMSKRLKEAARTGPITLIEKPAKKKRPAKPLYDKVYK